YLPAFCDVVVMVEGNASMYLGSPRMVEVVVGEKVDLESLGGARMHCTESGCGDALVADDKEAIEFGRSYFRFMPQRAGERPGPCDSKPPRTGSKSVAELVPTQANQGYDMRKVIEAFVDEGSWLEIKKLFAKEILTGFARLDGQAIGVSPISRCRRAACCSTTRRTRPRDSSGFAMHSRSRFCSWP